MFSQWTRGATKYTEFTEFCIPATFLDEIEFS